MDHTGDSRHTFDPYDPNALAQAEQRFKELTAQGFTAAVRTGPGESRRLPAFDPTAEETLFFPRLIGG
jgi:Na+-transporting NADH:ubiquinone oxidoreductase subunit NqrA